jgi:hypothetical protein
MFKLNSTFQRINPVLNVAPTPVVTSFQMLILRADYQPQLSRHSENCNGMFYTHRKYSQIPFKLKLKVLE